VPSPISSLQPDKKTAIKPSEDSEELSPQADEAEDAGDLEEVDESVRTVHQLSYTGPEARLDLVLAEQLPQYSRTYLQQLIEDGFVELSPSPSKEIKPSVKVSPGAVIRVVVPPPRRPSRAPEPIPLEFLYEDEHIAVIDKPAGLAVHPAPYQEGSTLVNALLYWLEDLSGIAGVERPGIVHRLDKETSGVLVVAKHDVAHHSLAYQFRERQVHKTYLAIVRGEPVEWEGRVNYPIGRSPTHSKKMVVRGDGTGRTAVTDYRVLERFDGYALVECYPATGRTHQIRVHLAAIHLPVAGDKLYGREKVVFLSELKRRPREPGEAPILSRHALHAVSICFRHPVSREEVTFTAPLHSDMLNLLHALQRYRSPR
jgi:23S rRNA pseudouridine1911/1915/1917 synthase